MCVSHQRGQDIEHSVEDAAVTGRLDRRDVFELIVNGFDDRAPASQKLIGQGHQFGMHVFADFGNQV